MPAAGLTCQPAFLSPTCGSVEPKTDENLAVRVVSRSTIASRIIERRARAPRARGPVTPPRASHASSSRPILARARSVGAARHRDSTRARPHDRHRVFSWKSPDALVRVSLRRGVTRRGRARTVRAPRPRARWGPSGTPSASSSSPPRSLATRLERGSGSASDPPPAPLPRANSHPPRASHSPESARPTDPVAIARRVPGGTRLRRALRV